MLNRRNTDSTVTKVFHYPEFLLTPDEVSHSLHDLGNSEYQQAFSTFTILNRHILTTHPDRHETDQAKKAC